MGRMQDARCKPQSEELRYQSISDHQSGGMQQKGRVGRCCAPTPGQSLDCDCVCLCFSLGRLQSIIIAKVVSSFRHADYFSTVSI